MTLPFMIVSMYELLMRLVICLRNGLAIRVQDVFVTNHIIIVQEHGLK